MTINKIISRAAVLAVLALLVAAGIRWHLQNKIEGVLEDVIQELYPVAVINYENVSTSLLNSSIGVERVTINPRAVRDEIKIESIIFQAPNIKFLIDAKNELESGNIPEKMSISINGLSINTSGSLAKFIDNNTPPPSLGARDKAYGCADVKQFKFSELDEMGYDQMSIDLIFNYQYNPTLSELDITALWSNRQMFGFEITGTFEVENDKFKLDQKRWLFDKMSSLNITYRDFGYNQSTINYCNNNRGDTNYLSAHIDAFKQDLKRELSIIPSDTLVEAYRTFMLDSGTINISSNLQRPMNPRYLALYNPRDVVLLLSPEITVNGQPVDIPYDKLLKTSGKANEVKTTDDVGENKEIVLKPQTTPAFINLGISQLGQHIGEVVQVKTDQGITRTGTLVYIDTKTIKVEVTKYGGLIAYPIQISRITNAELMTMPSENTNNKD